LSVRFSKSLKSDNLSKDFVLQVILI